jgi:hypothetical protein
MDITTLKHAFGKAKDVPGLLEALESKDETQQDQAFQNLSLCLVSGGSVFPASVAAVPMLQASARRTDGRSRALSLILLAELAAAGTDDKLTTGVDLSDSTTKKVFAKAPLKDCRAAVLEGSADYFGMLEDPDARVRAAAAFLLGFLPEVAPKALAPLKTALARDTDEYALGSALLATALLLKVAKTGSEGVLDVAYKATSTPLQRGLVALAHRIVRGTNSVDELGDVLGLIPLAYVGSDRFPWCQGRLDLLVVNSIKAGGASAELEPTAIALVAAAKERGATAPANDAIPGRWARLALELTFPKSANNEVVSSDISDAGKRVFSAITESQLLDKPGVVPGDFGLPSSIADARRWLGLEPPGPLDPEVSIAVGGASKTLPVWKVLLMVLRGTLPQSVWEEAADAQLTPEQLFDAYCDAALNVYNTSLPSGHPERVVSQLGKEAVERSMKFASKLVQAKQSGTRVPGSAALFALNPLVTAKLAIPGELDEIVISAIVDKAAPSTLILCVPPERRDDVILAAWSRNKDPGFGLKAVAPAIAAAPSAKLAEAIVAALPKINGPALVPVAIDTLKAIGALATPAIRLALENKDTPYRDQLAKLV